MMFRKTLRNQVKHSKINNLTSILSLGTSIILAYSVLLSPSYAQQIIIDGKTNTNISVSGNVTDISTSTIQGDNAFNSFNRFNVTQGNVVNLNVPSQANNLINLVNNSPSTINGVVNSIKNGHIGGNVFFLNPYGVLVGSQGVINTGSLTIITPTKEYMDGFFNSANNPNDTSVNLLLNGQAPVNPLANVINNGKINTKSDITINAGNVGNSGQINSSASFQENNITTGDIVNLHDLNNASVITSNAGKIQIISQNDIVNTGVLFSDGSSNVNAGDINLAASGNITILQNSTVSASGQTQNSNGGFINLTAQKDINFLNNPIISASGSSINGNGGNVKLTAGNVVNVDQAIFLLNSSNDINGKLEIDPIFVNIKNLYSFGADIKINASNSINLIDDGFLTSKNYLGTGKSGNIELNAPNIHIGNNSGIVSLAAGEFDSGYIKLISNDINTGNDLPSIFISSGNKPTIISRQTLGDIVIGRTAPLNLPLWTRDKALWVNSEFVNTIKSNNIVFGNDPLTNNLTEYVVLSNDLQRTGDITLSGNYRSAIWDNSNISINGNLNLISGDKSLILDGSNVSATGNINLISNNIAAISKNVNVSANNLLFDATTVVGASENTVVHAFHNIDVIADEFLVFSNDANNKLLADNKFIISRKTFGDIHIASGGSSNIFKPSLSKIFTPLLIIGNTGETNSNTNEIFVNTTDSDLFFNNDIQFIAPNFKYYGGIKSSGNILIKTDYLYDGVYYSGLLGKFFDLVGPSTNIQASGFINIQKYTPGIINISNYDSNSTSILNLFPMSVDKLKTDHLMIGNTNNLLENSVVIDNPFYRNGNLELYGNIINIGFDNQSLFNLQTSKDFSIFANVVAIGNILNSGNTGELDINTGGSFNINTNRSLFVGTGNSGVINLNAASYLNFNAPGIIVLGQNNTGTIKTSAGQSTSLSSPWIYVGYNNSGDISINSGSEGFNSDSSSALILDNNASINSYGPVNINTNDIYLYPKASINSLKSLMFTRKDPGQILITPSSKMANTSDSIFDITSTELSQMHADSLILGDPLKANTNVKSITLGGSVENFNNLIIYAPNFTVLPDTYVDTSGQISITTDILNIDTTSNATELLTNDLTLSRYSIGDMLIGPNGFVTLEELSKIGFTGLSAGNNPTNINTNNITNLVNFSVFNNLSFSGLGNTTIGDGVFLGGSNIILDGLNVNIGNDSIIRARNDIRIISNDLSITNNTGNTSIEGQSLYLSRKTYGNLEISPTGVISSNDWNAILVKELYIGNNYKTNYNTDNVFIKESLYAPGDINISSYFDTVFDPNIRLQASNISIDGDIVELNDKSSLDAIGEIRILANVLNTNGIPNLSGDSFIFSRHTPGDLSFSANDLNFFGFNFITFGNSQITNQYTQNIEFFGNNLVFRPNTVINAINDVKLVADKITVNTTSPINKINARNLIINRYTPGDISIAPDGTISQDELNRFIVDNLRIGNFGSNLFNTENVNFAASQYFPGDIFIAANNSINFANNALLISDQDINLAAPSIYVGLNSYINTLKNINAIADNFMVDINSIYPSIEGYNVGFGRLTSGNIEISNNGILSPSELRLVSGNIFIGNDISTTNNTNNIIFNAPLTLKKNLGAISSNNIFVNSSITTPLDIYLKSNQVSIIEGASLSAQNITIETPQTNIEHNTSINALSDITFISDNFNISNLGQFPVINADQRIFLGRYTNGDILITPENYIESVPHNPNSLILDPSFIQRLNTNQIFIGNPFDSNYLPGNIILAGSLNLKNNVALQSQNSILIENIPNIPVDSSNINLFAKNIRLDSFNLQFGKNTTIQSENDITMIADKFIFDPLSTQGGIFAEGNVTLSRKTPGNFGIVSSLYYNDVFNYFKYTKNEPFTLLNIADINNINCNLIIGNNTYSTYNIHDILVAADIIRNTGGISLLAGNNIDLYSSSLIKSIGNIILHASNYVYIDGTSSLLGNNVDISGISRVFIADNAQIISNNNINIFSYNVNAIGNPIIRAGNNIIIDSILSTTIADSAIFKAGGNINLNGSLIFISNNSNISAGRDINIISGDYTSISGNSEIFAGRDLFLSSGNYISLFDAAALTSGGTLNINYLNSDFGSDLSNYIFSSEDSSDNFRANGSSKEEKEKVVTQGIDTTNNATNQPSEKTLKDYLSDNKLDEKLKDSVGFDLLEKNLLEGYDINTELEADAKGIEFASELNYKPEGLRDFLTNIKLIETILHKNQDNNDPDKKNSSTSGFLGYLHPKTEERIDKINTKIEKEKLDKPSNKSFDKKYRKILQILRD